MKHWMKMAIAGAMVILGTAAQASTIAVWNDTQFDSPANALIYRGDVTCTACQVLSYVPSTFSFSSSLGELFKGPTNSGDANEAAWANSVLGTSFTGANVTAGKVETGIFDSFNYITNSLYVILKVGRDPNYTILKNTSAGAMTWSYAPKTGTGAGLSHYVNLGGTPSPVPLPAAGGLLLAALGAVAALRRRKV